MVHTPRVVTVLLASPPDAVPARETCLDFCSGWNTAHPLLRLEPRRLEIPGLTWLDPREGNPHQLPDVDLGLVVLGGEPGRQRPAAWSRTADLLRRLQRRGVALQLAVAPGRQPGQPGGVPASFLDQLGGRLPLAVAGDEHLPDLVRALVREHVRTRLPDLDPDTLQPRPAAAPGFGPGRAGASRPGALAGAPRGARPAGVPSAAAPALRLGQATIPRPGTLVAAPRPGTDPAPPAGAGPATARAPEAPSEEVRREPTLPPCPSSDGSVGAGQHPGTAPPRRARGPRRELDERHDSPTLVPAPRRALP